MGRLQEREPGECSSQSQRKKRRYTQLSNEFLLGLRPQISMCCSLDLEEVLHCLLQLLYERVSRQQTDPKTTFRE